MSLKKFSKIATGQWGSKWDPKSFPGVGSRSKLPKTQPTYKALNSLKKVFHVF
jgi:hypothetical protein